jgi:hypothetical protein
MKKITYLVLLFLLSNFCLAQMPSLAWVKKADTFTLLTSKVDTAGNFYTIGQFRGTLDVDLGISIYNLTTVSPTIDEYFISKSDTNGNFIWAKKLQDYTYSIAIDSMGNVFIPSANGISKFDIYGNLIWHKNLTVDPWDSLIFLDNNNNIFLTGLFVGTKDFDPNSNVHNLTSIGYDDVFLLKLDSDGNFNWVKQIKSNAMSWANSMATDGSGNVYITGDYTAALDFTTSTGNFQLPFEANDEYPRYILKLDSSGNFLWSKKIGGYFGNTLNSLVVDAVGNVYLSDEFFYTIDVDPNAGTHTISNLTGATNTSSDFLLKLDQNGNFVWVNQFERRSMVTIDTENNVYTKGTSSNVNFPEDMNKYDSNGTLLWTMNNVPGELITVDGNGSIFVSGYFVGTHDFDPSANVFNLTTVSKAPFVQKLNQPTLSNTNFNESQTNIYPNPTTGIFNIKRMLYIQVIQLRMSMVNYY